MSFYINSETNEPMTVQEKLDKYPNGQCPLCGGTACSYGADVDEGELTYFIECDSCHSQFVNED